MAAWKLDLVFEANGRGWQETYYADFGVPDFDGVSGYAEKLASLRVLMSAAPVQIKAWRVSDPLTTGRQGISRYFNPRKAAPEWAPTTGAADPSTAVNVGFLKVATNQNRRISVRGVPDDIVTDFGELRGPQYAAWKDGPFAAWVQCLLGNAGNFGNRRYGWFSRLPLNVPAGEVTYTFAVGAWYPTLNLPADFFALEDKGQKRYVRISGVNGGQSRLNGEQVVYVVERNQARLVKPLALGPMVTPGLMQRYATLPTFIEADRINVEKAGRRAPGRPLLVTPGRARATARS